jgi:hypothetical protein
MWEDFTAWVYDINRTCEENDIEEGDVKIYCRPDEYEPELIVELPNGTKIVSHI